jgi:hypothetical protein
LFLTTRAGFPGSGRDEELALSRKKPSEPKARILLIDDTVTTYFPN